MGFQGYSSKDVTCFYDEVQHLVFEKQQEQLHKDMADWYYKEPVGSEKDWRENWVAVCKVALKRHRRGLNINELQAKTYTIKELEMRLRETLLARKAITGAARAMTDKIKAIRDEITLRNGAKQLKKIEAEVDEL